MLGWTVRAAWLLALVTTVLQLIGVMITAGAAPGQLTANPLTVSIETAEPLKSVGQNSYGGGAHIEDDATVIATRITAQVHGVASSVRVGLAFGPLVWALTGAGVALCLTVAFGRSTRKRVSKSFAVAALIIAVGTSLGQILDEIARTGLQGVMWHGSTGMHRVGSGAGFTFQFGWLAIAIALLAVSVISARGRTEAHGATPDLYH